MSPSASVLPHFVWQIDLTVACPVLLLEHGGVLHVVPDCFLLKHSVLHDPYSSHASALVYLADTSAMDFALEASRVGQVIVPQWMAPAEQAAVVLQHSEVLQVGRLESKA